MTPTCSIGAALRERVTAMGGDEGAPYGWLRERVECHGPLSPIQVVPDEVLVAKYPHGTGRDPSLTPPSDEWGPFRTEADAACWRESFPAAYLSLDQLRELLTVGGKCPDLVCQNGYRPHGATGDLVPCEVCHGTGREFAVCSRHAEMLKPEMWADYDDEGNRVLVPVKPPQLRLSDLLRVGRTHESIPHPALTEALEWAERLGFDREKVS